MLQEGGNKRLVVFLRCWHHSREKSLGVSAALEIHCSVIASIGGGMSKEVLVSFAAASPKFYISLL